MSFMAIPAKQQQGFILAATLWLIAFITVAGTYLAQWAGEAKQQIASQQQNTQAEIDFQGTLATFLYLINTQYVNQYGVMLTEITAEQKEADTLGSGMGLMASEGSYIKLYDQAYHGIGDVIFSVQDESGLIATNIEEPFHLKYLLGLFGLSATARDEAIAKLQDYEDSDSLHRINGAEEQQYKQQHKQAPANRALLTSWEMQNVLDWDKYPELWQNDLPRLTSSSWGEWPNFNAAPNQVLQTSMGITREDAEKIIQARNELPITDLGQLYQIIGKVLSIDVLSFSSIPSNFFRVTLWHPQTGRAREIHLELHPSILVKDYSLKTTRPWTVDYQLDIAKTAEQQHVQPKQLKTDLFNDNSSQVKQSETSTIAATQ
ncbi:MAG: type II secretion system protein GspK [Methylovulum sp.]|nr:type II secretion system protein GspK [Methylovulum sp.]